MYIEIHNYKDFNQEALYFKLNNAFNMDSEDGKTHKLAGIYAIYKDDVCLYVGQSKNLASRIATHIRGKYANASEIYVFHIEDIGFSDFSDRSKSAQQTILDNCEKYLMSKLKPIDNIDIDMDFTLDENKRPNIEEETLRVGLFEDDVMRITNGYNSAIDEVLDLYYDLIIANKKDEILSIIDFKEKLFEVIENISKICVITYNEKIGGAE